MKGVLNAAIAGILFCSSAHAQTNQTALGLAGAIAKSLQLTRQNVFYAAQNGAKCDGTTTTTDQAAFVATLAQIQASPQGGTLVSPPGDCMNLSALSITIGAKQRFSWINGANVTRLHFANSASAGLAITMAPVATGNWITNGPSVTIEGLTGVTDWSTTTAQTFISVIVGQGNNTSTFTRPIPPAVSMRNLNTASSTNSGGFATLLSLSGVNISKLENISLWGSPGDTTANAVSLSSVAVETGIRFQGLRQQGGGTALAITDSYQGIYVTDMQTVSTQHSITWSNASYTGSDSLIVDHSQLNSAVAEVTTNGVLDVQVMDNYLLAGGTGWCGVCITGGAGHIVSSNDFRDGATDATASGIVFTNVSTGNVVGNNLLGIKSGSSSAAPILLAGTTSGVTVGHNNSNWTYVGWDNSSDPTQNAWADTNIGTVGNRPSVMHSVEYAAGSNLAFWTPLSADSNVQVIMHAKGLAGIDWNFQDGVGRELLELQDNQLVNGGGSGFSMNATASNHSAYFTSSGVEDFLLGPGPGPLAANVTNGLLQIAYTSAAPTGTPSSSGGATVLYNSGTHTLNIYDPAVPGWYHVTLTSGSN